MCLVDILRIAGGPAPREKAPRKPGGITAAGLNVTEDSQRVRWNLLSRQSGTEADGVITDLCTDPLSPTCVPRPHSILTATIDETSGALQKVWAVYDQNVRPLWAYTISGPYNQIAIGGRWTTNLQTAKLYS